MDLKGLISPLSFRFWRKNSNCNQTADLKTAELCKQTAGLCKQIAELCKQTAEFVNKQLKLCKQTTEIM